jgi:surfactin family lipopeptide synthetase A
MNVVDDVANGPSEGQDEVYAFPASSAQQRLWFLDQLEPGTAVYSIPQALRLRGELDRTVLERALREIVVRHESLRTTFAAPEGDPLQVVHPEPDLRFGVQSVASLPESEREAEARRLVQVEAERAFDLAEGPLFRAGLIELTERDRVLWLNVHHIVCDGWSLALLYGELSALYRAFTQGQASPLEEVPIQYADFALWQREIFQGEALDKEIAFWKSALAPHGASAPVLELPTDRLRPPTPTIRGDQLSFAVSRELSDRLIAVGKSESASLFQTLLSAFYVWLHRLSGQSEVLVGSPVANRERAEVEKAIGFYTNTVVFRGELSDAPSFRELVRRTQKSVLAGLAHQDVPFERVVEAVQPNRGAGFQPLFQAMFAVQRAPESALDLPGVKAELWNVHPRTSKFDVLLEMQEVSSGLQCFFEYNTDLFDDSTAARFVESFLVLLEAAASAPDTSVDDLPVLSDSGRKAQLVDWNATQAELPPKCVHELVAERARLSPEAVAVSFEGSELRHGELEVRSNQLARLLVERGVEPGARVGIFLERSPELLVALLAVAKAGAAYLPLDPAYPADRVAYMLSDSGASLVLTRAAEAAALPDASERSPTRLLLDEEAANLDAQSKEPLEGRATPASVAYLLYTSGSTGKPKGVVIPHGALTNFLVGMQREPGLSASDRLLAVTTVSFDISGLELYLPLVTGATIVLASRDLAADGDELVRTLERERITVMQATPATFRLMIDAGWERSPDLRVLCGGEALPPELAEALLERTAELWNMYGPTETTIWSTTKRITDAGDITIGRPIANTTIYVLDAKMQPVVVGVPGDLYIGGAGVALGYWGRDDLTKERFLPDPYGPEGARIYKTGDRARYRPDGSLIFLGRSDNQVKVRGYRIELGEIEAVLAHHPAIERNVVVVRSDASGDQRIVAYCVYGKSGEPTASELRKHLRAELPEYMVPHLFVAIDELPLTDNNKVDRKALPDPFGHAVGLGREHVEPKTDTERLVAEIWREVLKTDSVGLNDNFFEIGGHSLLSMQVIVRLEKRIGHRLNPRSMAFSTLEQIAAECDAARSPAKGEATPASAGQAAPTGAAPAQPAGGDKTRSEPARAPAAKPAPEPEGLGQKLFGALKGRFFKG